MLKYPFALFLLFAFVSASSAQTASSADAIRVDSGLRILNYDWAKYKPSLVSIDSGSAVDDTSGRRLEDQRLERQVFTERRRDPRSTDLETGRLEDRRTRRQRSIPETTDSLKPSRRRGQSGYCYTVELQNEGIKKVKAVDWEYLFLDSATNQELVRRGFSSKVNIGAGKRKKIQGVSYAAPYGVIDVKGLEDKGAGERVQIVRVVYEDGTVWEGAR